MKKDGNWDTKEKNKCRKEAVKKIGKKPYKCAIFLPSLEGLDLKLALKNGIIAPEATHLILVENSKRQSFYEKTIVNQKKWCKKNGFKHVDYHYGDLHKLNLADYLIEGEKVDFAFIDICGSIFNGIADWLCYCRDMGFLSNNIRLSFTNIMTQIECRSEIHQMFRMSKMKISQEDVLCLLSELLVNYRNGSDEKLKELLKEYEKKSKHGAEFLYILTTFIYEIFKKFSNGGLTLYDIHGYCDKTNGRGFPMLFVHTNCNLIPNENLIDVNHAKAIRILERQKNRIENRFAVDLLGQKFDLEGKDPSRVCAGIIAQAKIFTKEMKDRERAEKIIALAKKKAEKILEYLV